MIKQPKFNMPEGFEKEMKKLENKFKSKKLQNTLKVAGVVVVGAVIGGVTYYLGHKEGKEEGIIMGSNGALLMACCFEDETGEKLIDHVDPVLTKDGYGIIWMSDKLKEFADRKSEGAMKAIKIFMNKLPAKALARKALEESLDANDLDSTLEENHLEAIKAACDVLGVTPDTTTTF